MGGKEFSYAFLAWNLLAGAIGYLFFTLLKLPVFAQFIPFTPISTLTLLYVAYALLLGLVGSLLAIFIGGCFQLFGRVMAKFGDRVVLRTLVAGVVIAVVVTLFPEVMFTGVRQIFPMIHNPASYGVWLLLLFALLCDLVAGPFLQERISRWPDIPDLICSNDGRTGPACALSGPSSLHPGVVH